MQMYAKGMSQRDIEDTLKQIYGTEISQGLVSRITDKILPEVNEWQNRPLEAVYPVVFFDGIVFNSRKDNKIVTKCVHSVLGINMEGHKEILGTWISENEFASFYASICLDLKSRGVKDIFIACHYISFFYHNRCGCFRSCSRLRSSSRSRDVRPFLLRASAR